MPGNNPHPAVAFVGDFDARPWAGQELFSRNSVARTMPALASLPPRYCDLMSFLNGRHTTMPLAELLFNAVLASSYVNKATTTFTVGITNTDKVFVECNYPFRLNATAHNGWLGFSTTTAHNSIGTGPYRITAGLDWVRGPLRVASALWSITMDPSGANVSCTSPTAYTYGWFQDVPTFLRGPSTSDEDSTFADSCLQTIDRLAGDDIHYRWFLDALGRVNASWYGSTGALTWTSQSFSRALGFTGLESTTLLNGGCYNLCATNPVALVPSRGLARLDRGQVEDCATKRFDDGSYAGVHHGSFERLFAELYLDGPADLRAPNGRDLERHFLRWLRANPTGSRVTFYQHWGDPRRALATADVDATAAGSAYSLTRTSEEDGRRGRVICYRAPGLEEWRASYEHTIRSGAPVTLTLDPEA